MSIKTILILAANPKSTSPLRLSEEVREIEEGLQRSFKSEQFKLVQKWAVRSRDFYRAILECQPQIVHFCGHGAGVEGIVLEDETGQPSLVEKEALAKLFKLFAVKGVECVVLNACYSEEQAQAISQYIKYVVGMNQAIGDKAAINFAVAFYDALAAGEEVEFAFNLGCTQLIKLKEDQTPVLKITPIHTADIQFEAGDIPPNPYQGLSAFGEKDAAFFFGREKFTDELFEMTHKQPLVAIVGASGSGKSSVVFAGLIPQLRDEGIWLIESFRPKSQPFDELALALVRQLEPNIDGVEKAIKVGKLALNLNKGEVKLHQIASQLLENKPNKRFLLVVDQFEELYTQCEDKEEQQRFIDTLLADVNQKSLTLVFTLRADFYGYVLSYRPFSDALRQFPHEPLGLMSREELQAAIEQPAQKLKVQLQTHLTERILDDVGQEPGNLPLLEFALTQLWNQQKNNELTHKAYDEIGGIKQALIKHAEAIYNKLNDIQQKQAQRIFLQLVRLGEGTEDTRRVATLEEVGKDNWELIAYLAGAESRLVVTGRNDKSEQETVEVVHEALIREWGRLREWVDENRDALRKKQNIEKDAKEWQKNGKPNDYLLQRLKLAEAKNFLQHHAVNLPLSPLEKEFVEKSIQRRRNNRILRVSTVTGLIVFLTGLTAFTFKLYLNAQLQADTANAGAVLEIEGLIKSIKVGKKLRQLQQLSAMVEPDTRYAVLTGLQRVVSNVKEINRFKHDSAVNSVSFSPDGKTIASASDDQTIKLWTLNGESTTLGGHNSAVNSVSFSPNGKTIASASDDQTIKLWTLNGESTTLGGHNSAVNSVSFSPNGKTIASASDDQTIKLWTLNGKSFNGKLINTLTGHNGAVRSVSFSPDGQTIISASDDQTIKLWTLNGKSTTLGRHNGAVNSVSFSPDGKMIASASEDNTVKLWTFDSKSFNGKVIATLTGHRYKVYGVSFSPNKDNIILASASKDNTVKLWRPDGNLITSLTGHSGAVNSISFSPNGKIIASASDDKIIKLWEHNRSSITHDAPIWDVSFSKDDRILATASDDSTVKLWQPDGTLIKTLKGHKAGVTDVTFSYKYAWQKDIIASASDDGTVNLWKLDGTGSILMKTLKGHKKGVTDVLFNEQKPILASASKDTTIKLWKLDGTDGTLMKTLEGHKMAVNDVSFSGDNIIASASDDQTIKLWTLDGILMKTLEGHKTAVNDVDFRSDGQMIASASDDQTIKLWKRDGKDFTIYKTLDGHSARVTDVTFSKDGKMIASASDDKTVKFWWDDGSLITTLTGHSAGVTDVFLAKNSKLLASASHDGTVILWNFNLDELLNRGCNWLQKYLQNKNNGMKDNSLRHVCDS